MLSARSSISLALIFQSRNYSVIRSLSLFYWTHPLLLSRSRLNRLNNEGWQLSFTFLSTDPAFSKLSRQRTSDLTPSSSCCLSSAAPHYHFSVAFTEKDPSLCIILQQLPANSFRVSPFLSGNLPQWCASQSEERMAETGTRMDVQVPAVVVAATKRGF